MDQPDKSDQVIEHTLQGTQKAKCDTHAINEGKVPGDSALIVWTWK